MCQNDTQYERLLCEGRKQDTGNFLEIYVQLQIFAVRLFSAIKTIYHGGFCVKRLVDMSYHCVCDEKVEKLSESVR